MPSRISNTPSVPAAPLQPTTYSVRSGDTLSKIAQRYGTTVDALRAANPQYPSLSDPRTLQVGWRLNIPGGVATPSTPSTPAQPTAPSRNDNIVMVGMNPMGKDEAAVLRRTGANVQFIGDSFEDGKIRSGGRTFDLTNDAGIEEFVGTFNLPADQSKKIADAIREFGIDARDEIGQLAKIWSQAERGGQIPSRLVLSGHHVGYGVYGEDNGTLDWKAFKSLTAAMPKAAGQIEDLHIAGCYSLYEADGEKYQRMFPSLKTMWGYNDSAPGSWTGAMDHQRAWERATRGDTDGLDRSVASRFRKGKAVAVWSREGGYVSSEPPRPLAEVRRQVSSGEGAFNRAFSGQETIASAQTGPVRDYYRGLQELARHPDLSSTERRQVEQRRDQTIRLLYFGSMIAPRFQQAYGAQLSAGYQAVGATAPNFGRMTRAETLAAIADLESRVTRSSPPAAREALSLLQRGLRDLEPALIPDAWV